jgi:predicted TIM-barrel fold metal-dependent hydrolase
MDTTGLLDVPVVDCHVHFDPDRDDPQGSTDRFAALMDRVMKRTGITQAYVSSDWAGLCLKAASPSRYYVGGYVPWSMGASREVPSWKNLVDGLMAGGFDGVGETGSKPGPRESFKMLAGDYYSGLWRMCESRRVAILCHVADPEEFWVPGAAPQWAQERNWVYGANCPAKEELYEDLRKVLARHPEMSLVLAHFNFLSADTDRAAGFFENYAHVCFDLAPGIELLYNMSKRPAEWREFFVRYQDRILFGTDIAPWQTEEQAVARSWVVRMFLESTGEFFTPREADELMTRYDTPFHGLGLPREALVKIYSGNFQRVFGRSPRPVDLRSAARLAEEAGNPKVAEMLKRCA